MKTVIIDEIKNIGSFPDYQKYIDLGMDGVAVAPPDHDSLSGADRIKEIQSKGMKAYVWRSISWGFSSTGTAFANQLHLDLKNMAFATGWDTVPAVPNIETDDLKWITDFFTRWRILRPSRLTYWLFQPHKGGLYKLILNQIGVSNVVLCPEVFLGTPAMAEYAEQDVCDDLTDNGFDRGNITLVRNSRKLPYAYTHGFAFLGDWL